MSDDNQYRILVVDDDEILNNLFCAFLGSRGFETIAAAGVQEAKKCLMHDDRIDLLLLDYQLGDGVGLDLLDDESIKLYASMPPIIMISANESPEFLEQCFACGVVDYIIKPVNLSLLVLKVKALVNSVRLQRIVGVQKVELEKFKFNAEREEAIAKFTYEYLVSKNSHQINGITQYLQSCSSFSGDIAIARIAPSGDVYFILADATGHGLSAAITIMPVVTIFNSMVAKGFHLQQIVTEINRKLVNDTPADRFVAALAVEFNFTKKEMSIWNGAMPTAYWMESGNIIEKFPSRHMALGILDQNMFDADLAVFSMSENRLLANGLLFMCTDGLIEQENNAGEQFSLQRLENVLQSSVDNPLNQLLTALPIHAQTMAYSDDISICVLVPRLIVQQLYQQQERQQVHQQELYPFSWGVKISGQKLANADLPPMANDFLHYLGIEQKICQKVFSIINEMVSNSIDHGILKLSSILKQNQEGFMQFFIEKEKLLKQLTDDDFIELRLDCLDIDGAKKLVITCRDSGEGYDYRDELSKSNSLDSGNYFGRGVALIRGMSEFMEVYAPGNFIKVIL